MTAGPIDLTEDMVAIEQHWREGQRLQAAGLFTIDEWSEHQAISYTALMVLGMDCMLRVGRGFGAKRESCGLPRNHCT